MALLRVARCARIAEAIHLFELRDPAGAPLAPFTAGAHVHVTSPSGFDRRYSLCNDPAERDRYVIAVKRDPAGHGGSVDLVDRARPDTTLVVSEPRNAFELDEKARGFLFVAAGIGITPILSMVRHCMATARPFRLVYLTRSPGHTAFLEDLSQATLAGRITLHHDDGDPSRAFDLWPLFERPRPEHIYACGPRPLLDDIRAMTGHWPMSAIHFESFVDAAAGARPLDRPFTVVLARSGERIVVPVGTSILEALRVHGHDAPSSCESGTCGTCRTRLLGGEADHRDFVLMEDEQADQVMICVSRSRSEELVIDR